MNPTTNLASIIKQEIDNRTGRMISDLRVVVSNGSIILSGSTPCAYPKQLAHSAAVTVACNGSTIRNNITVREK